MDNFEVKEAKLIDFNSLSFEKQKEHYENVARRALELWGYPQDSKLKLLNITENATYRVEHPDHETIVMRVHRLHYAEKESIQTEIAWILDLKSGTDINLATPLKALNGTYVQTIETPQMAEKRNVVCFSYVNGKAPKDSHDDTETIGGIASVLQKIPSKITIPTFRLAATAYARFYKIFPSLAKNTLTPEDVKMYHKLGEIAAALHDNSKKWTPPDFYKRIEWDWETTFGEGWNNYYGAHYTDIKGVLSNSDIKVIDECALLIKKRTEVYGKSPERYGMIHSDLRMPNLLIEGENITVLDFDDCGKGWYMYDLACVVGFMEHRPDLQNIIDIIVEGYRKHTSLSDEDKIEIQTFILMRRIGLLQAIIYHIDNTQAGSGESAELTPEIMAFYAKGTAILAREYIKKYEKMPLLVKK